MHEHFLYLTPESLGGLVEMSGFEVAEIQETGGSRPFGFSLVARKTSRHARIGTGSARRSSAATIQASYHRGRELLVAEEKNLMRAAQMAAEAAFEHPPARVCFFGANQTASEIAAHLRAVASDMPLELVAYDNSDAKQGMTLAGFSSPVQIPTANLFEPHIFHVCVICSRGWTREIAEQICTFRLPGALLIDGSSAQVLPCSTEPGFESPRVSSKSNPILP